MNACFFGDSENPLYGVHHSPENAPARDLGVLLCPAVSKEYMRAHWAYRELGDRLSAAGFPVLRFDFSGTGDSSGDAEDADLNRWTRDIFQGAEELKEASGVTRIALVGLRAGGLIATLAVQAGLPVEKLILWDPVISGARYLDELTRAGTLASFGFSESLVRELGKTDLIGGLVPRARDIAILTAQPDALADVLARRWSRAGNTCSVACVPDAGGWDLRESSEARLRVNALPRAIESLLREAV